MLSVTYSLSFQPLAKNKREAAEAGKPFADLEVGEILSAFTEKVTAYESHCANQSYSLKLLDELSTLSFHP